MEEKPRSYADVHIAKEAVVQLRRKGVDILHCGDVEMADAHDVEHLNYTTEQKRVLVSCDDDFIRLHWEWQQSEKEHSGIVYFSMPDQCKSIGVVVHEIFFLYEIASYPDDLYNKLWRVKT